LTEKSWSPERQRLGEQVGMLLRALRSHEDGVKELAIVQLSLLGPKAVPYLASALEAALDESSSTEGLRASRLDPEREIEGICRTLGIIRDSSAVMDLADALPRKEAVEALAKTGGERALELVMGTIASDSKGGGPLRNYESWSPHSSDRSEENEEFVGRVFLCFGEIGRRRLDEEMGKRPSAKRAAAAEVIRILGQAHVREQGTKT